MKNYDEIISLGTQCNPGLSLRALNLKKETYPFDWVRSNSKIIYDVLLNGKNNYITFDKEKSNDYYTKHLHCIDLKDFPLTHINSYGQYFTHYTELDTIALKNTFDKYLDRFFEVLNSNKKVLFIHTHEEYIYHKKSRDAMVEFYNYLCKINDLLEEKYPKLRFEIINIDINNNFENYKNIININMEYNLPISDNAETHVDKFYEPYRETITKEINKYLYNKI